MTMNAEFPPRGSGVEGRVENPPTETWGHPGLLGPAWDWQPGSLLLGRSGERLLGIDDDRHACTLAGTRAGKSSTVLKHNLARYPGSVIVTDPKGELAKATVEARRAMGQECFVFDPFGETMFATAAYNPFSELGFGRPEHVAADAALLADALIIPSEREPHWTDAARNLIRGLILHLIDAEPETASLRRVRAILHSTPAELEDLATAMADSEAFDGIVANEGRSLLGKILSGSKELSGIISTAQEQTGPIDDVLRVTERSDLKLTDLRNGNITIYLVLPGMRMATHFRWMRLMVQLALAAMERAPVPRGQTPVLFMLEEFAALGPMRQIEAAAGLFAGHGVRLWTVLQDLNQLKTHYPKSWETFLGNAGVIQAFGNVDLTTTEYLSRLLGTTQVVERQDIRVSAAAMASGDNGRREHPRSVRLLESNEVTRHFARETGRQLILVPGRPPIYMERMHHHEV